MSDYNTLDLEREEQKSPQTLDFTGFERAVKIVDNVDKKSITLILKAFLGDKKSTLEWV